MRLIDADALGVGRCSRDLLPADYCAGWNGLVGLIEDAPTIDAVEVVRCKDCKYFRENIDRHGGVHMNCIKSNHIPKVEADHFCSYGERRSHHDSLCDQEEDA